MSLGAQPVLPDRLQGEDLGVPVLLPAQPFPAALQRHQREQPPGRVDPKLHHHRVRSPARARWPSGHPLGDRHVPRRVGAAGAQGLARAGAAAASSTAPNALLGLITFGTTVQVHELGYEHCAKSYTFSGKRTWSQASSRTYSASARAAAARGAEAAVPRALRRLALPPARRRGGVRHLERARELNGWTRGRRQERATRARNGARARPCHRSAVGAARDKLRQHGRRASSSSLAVRAPSGPARSVAKELTEPMRSHH